MRQAARFDTPAGETSQLNDFYLIDEAKFGRLAADQLPPLFQSGALGLAYLHLASLGNMRGCSIACRRAPPDRRAVVH